MQTALSTTPARSADEKKAVMMLGDEQIGVRIGADGFLTRTLRTVRLFYGVHLYAASPSPKASDKVAPYQPGYMALVHAMGGQLMCPLTVRDPVTGQMRANPHVEYYPGTSIVRSVTATAVCAVRNPATGGLHVSVQTVTQDAEHMLRQKLMNMERDDLVRYMSCDEWEAEKAAGKAAGWYPVQLGAGIVLVANLRMAGVRDAIRDFQNAGQTLRQRACSKAERLAADHNAVTRRVWQYSQLRSQMAQGAQGPYEAGPRYVDVPCVAWVENHNQRELEAFMASLASCEQVSGVDELVNNFNTDDNDGEPDDDLEEGYVAPTPQLTERMEPEVIPASQAVRVQRVEPAPVAPAAAPPPAAPPGGNGKRGRLAKAWDEVPEELRPEMLRKVGAASNADLSSLSDGQVTALLDVVSKYLGGGE